MKDAKNTTFFPLQFRSLLNGLNGLSLAKGLLIPALLAGLCGYNLGAQETKELKIDREKLAGALAKAAQSLIITDEQVIQYAKEYMQHMDENNPLCKTTDSGTKKDVAIRLERIVSNIPADLAKNLNLDVLAYYVKDVNALAAASGDIRVFAGLMEVMTDDQILAVIGHEIGHVANKDSKDATITALRVSALKDAAGSVGATAAKLTSSQLSALAETLANATYSRSQESQADIYGYELLKKCGKDPANMATSLGVLLKLQQEAGSAQNSVFKSLFSSHPDLAKRIEALNKR